MGWTCGLDGGHNYVQICFGEVSLNAATMKNRKGMSELYQDEL
jgi:hypothetical protein